MNDFHYKTSDGNVFYTENAAQNHAKSLKDRSVSEVPVNSIKESMQVKSTEVSSTADYEKLKKADLIIIPKNEGLKISSKDTKAQIIEQINHSKSK
jgi:hypothetical protein